MDSAAQVRRSRLRHLTNANAHSPLSLVLRYKLHRHAPSVANGGMAEIGRPTTIAEGDARDLKRKDLSRGAARQIIAVGLPRR